MIKQSWRVEVHHLHITSTTERRVAVQELKEDRTHTPQVYLHTGDVQICAIRCGKKNVGHVSIYSIPCHRTSEIA